ncbi:hypothetical protein BCV69DRAFT_315322 [Microstroma glucosiphilum]|uniref:Endonuclease/exonuclease/phosphatase domain-containing protein n=1 Tax=Pseudomicrostroma glucosiphilum TaxID=1684307 RepID=A0A316TVX0_9BASI|nr:hypothetical protein BCV69DRAFT_315322 [Pseudomicrostroma glucosiphilum]PWN17679.1 hypothetical protein BCV69DRAFT_315322 [Pseudomicrostroma glucosiphilum]
MYNPPRSADTCVPLMDVFESNGGENGSTVVIGDFNAHHTWWEEHTTEVDESSDRWVTAVATLGFDLMTPPDTPTFCTHSGRYTTIDLAFTIPDIYDRIVECRGAPDWSSESDHLAVYSKIDLEIQEATSTPAFNMKRCDTRKLIEEMTTRWQAQLSTLPRLKDDPEAGQRPWSKLRERALRNTHRSRGHLLTRSPGSHQRYTE